jgi:tripartite ATP-independent transporter DctP family solute receptor
MEAPMRRILVLLLALSFTVATAQTTIRYTHFQPGRPDQPKHAAALAFERFVERASDGAIQVDLFPASQLGDAAEVLEGLQFGTIQMGVVHDGPISGFFRPIELFSIPYLFTDQAEAYSVFDGPFGEEFARRMVDESGLRPLGIADNGIRHFTNDVRPIRTPADMAGLKIRVQPSPIYEALVASLGASPSAIAWTELPSALQQGVVDGQENGVTNILAASLYQYQQYVSLDAHVYSVHVYLTSDAFWQSLSDDERAIVEQGVEIAKEIHRAMTAAQDLSAEQILTDVGMEVTVLTADEIEAFRALAQPAVLEYIEGVVDQALIDLLFEAIDAHRAN